MSLRFQVPWRGLRHSVAGLVFVMTVVVMTAVGAFWGGSAKADDLDKVTGTSQWRDQGRLQAKTEWIDWYKARRAWRLARQSFRLEAARNRLLARLLRRGRPKIRDVRRIVRARLTRPRAVTPRAPRQRVGRGRAPVRAAEDEDEDVLETRPSRRRAPPAPAYKVKPERLDKDGQAIDDEGDALLRGSGKRKR
ncbi:MAG: hypothetical protein KAI47_24780 [Deltaproteobacteria bacterium]|nr:hypothetical protein [Deltaproteobacteria bacterium]